MRAGASRRTLIRRAIPPCRTYRWATVYIPCDNNGDCTYGNGFRVLVDATDVIILRTPATDSDISFLEGEKLSWMVV